MNEQLLIAAKGGKTDRPPIWLMRQAGRILPQYRALRGKLSGFKELVKTPDLACEVTIQPIDELGVDAAIIFSDILVIPEAMGLDYEMVEKKGPWFPKTIRSESDLHQLRVATPEEDLNYVLEAIRLTRKELDGRVPLIGFAGAPWTIFSYMIEGQGTKTFSKARRMLMEAPELSHKILKMISESTARYLNAQIEAGAQIVQLFDSWAGILSKELYDEFGLPYLKQIAESITKVPLIVFARGAYFSMEDICKLPCEVIGLDWQSNIGHARKISEGKALQGNLDPALLYAPREKIRSSTLQMLDKFGPGKHIVNLGHGVYPDTPLDNVKVFVDTVKEYRYSTS